MRTKKLNIRVTYGESGYGINDLGEGKSPRFELVYMPTKEIIMKSDNPMDADKFMGKYWRKHG